VAHALVRAVSTLVSIPADANTGGPGNPTVNILGEKRTIVATAPADRI